MVEKLSSVFNSRNQHHTTLSQFNKKIYGLELYRLPSLNTQNAFVAVKVNGLKRKESSYRINQTKCTTHFCVEYSQCWDAGFMKIKVSAIASFSSHIMTASVCFCLITSTIIRRLLLFTSATKSNYIK